MGLRRGKSGGKFRSVNGVCCTAHRANQKDKMWGPKTGFLTLVGLGRPKDLLDFCLVSLLSSSNRDTASSKLQPSSISHSSISSSMETVSSLEEDESSESGVVSSSGPGSGSGSGWGIGFGSKGYSETQISPVFPFRFSQRVPSHDQV